MIDLRLGRYQDVMADVEADHVISDPPYGARTHAGIKTARNDGSEGVAVEGFGYDHWTPDDVHEFVRFWGPRNKGWFCCMTSHDLIPAYEAAYKEAGLYHFAPVECVMMGANVRMVGDGPANWAVHLMVARPKRLHKWGALPGAYVGPPNRDGYPGGKPEWLMGAIIRDYSQPGELIADPCTGFGTTLKQALENGRRAVGSEVSTAAHERAQARLAQGVTPDLFGGHAA